MSFAICRKLTVLAVVIATLFGVAPAAVAAETVTVFAAASLKNALDEVSESFDEARVAISYAGSSTLARQIQQGAPADVYISANPQWMDILEQDGLITAESRIDLLGNRLVLIAHGDLREASVTIAPGMDLAHLLGEGRLAMALVDAVPAGMYGKAALQSLGEWEAVAPKVAQTDNVRAALALVARGEAPMGIVYATDAAAEDVAILGEFPAATHPAIIYPAAAVTGRDSPAALAFLAYLRGPAARAAFEAQGFTLLTD